MLGAGRNTLNFCSMTLHNKMAQNPKETRQVFPSPKTWQHGMLPFVMQW